MSAPRLRRLPEPSCWGVTRLDVGVAAALAGVGLVFLPWLDRFSDRDRLVDLGAVALMTLSAAVLAGRRRWPTSTLALVGPAVAVYLAVGYPFGPILLTVAVAVYTVARQERALRAAVAATVALALLLMHLPTHPAAISGPAGLVPAAAWVAIPFTVGLSRRLVSEAHARERAEADRRLVAAERLRLAQEVHDVVGHGLAAIQMQADIALHVGDGDPPRMRGALDAISRASEGALSELRTALATIHPHGLPPGGHRGPTPGLALLDDLRERVESAGVSVDVTVCGDPVPLREAVDLAAYRVLQEALTNVVKHSSHPRAAIEIQYLPEAVTLSVVNEALAASGGEGLGLPGLRRRVEQVSGRFSAGPDPASRTFVVRATLPTGGST